MESVYTKSIKVLVSNREKLRADSTAPDVTTIAKGIISSAMDELNRGIRLIQELEKTKTSIE